MMASLGWIQILIIVVFRFPSGSRSEDVSMDRCAKQVFQRSHCLMNLLTSSDQIVKTISNKNLTKSIECGAPVKYQQCAKSIQKCYNTSYQKPDDSFLKILAKCVHFNKTVPNLELIPISDTSSSINKDCLLSDKVDKCKDTALKGDAVFLLAQITYQRQIIKCADMIDLGCQILMESPLVVECMNEAIKVQTQMFINRFNNCMKLSGFPSEK